MFPAIAPVRLTDLRADGRYFTVAVGHKNDLSILPPFYFRGIYQRLEGVGKGAWMLKREFMRPVPPAFHPFIFHIDERTIVHAASIGLLIGSNNRSKYGDNHYRTFRYDLFRSIATIVRDQDFPLYEKIAGEREPLTEDQRVANQLLSLFIEAGVEAAKEHRLATTFVDRSVWGKAIKGGGK